MLIISTEWLPQPIEASVCLWAKKINHGIRLQIILGRGGVLDPLLLWVDYMTFQHALHRHVLRSYTSILGRDVSSSFFPLSPKYQQERLLPKVIDLPSHMTRTGLAFGGFPRF
jgi:hypothetical protein